MPGMNLDLDVDFPQSLQMNAERVYLKTGHDHSVAGPFQFISSFQISANQSLQLIQCCYYFSSQYIKAIQTQHNYASHPDKPSQDCTTRQTNKGQSFMYRMVENHTYITTCSLKKVILFFLSLLSHPTPIYFGQQEK
jgi:hypothetical protein